MKDSILNAISESGLKVLTDSPEEIVSDGIHIQTSPYPQGSEIPLGSSRMGGAPDLPEGFEWPVGPEGPLPFVGQLSLRDISSNGILPSSGVLYFFYDLATYAWGFDPEHGTSFHVHLFDGDIDSLSRAELPSSIEDRYDACSISTSLIPTLPEIDSIPPEVWKPTDEEADKYNDLMNRVLFDFERAGVPMTWLLGNAHWFGGHMQATCNLVTNGIPCGNRSCRDHPRYAELVNSANDDWRLLLQVGTDENGPGFCWGDMGTIFYWIRRDDLATGNFGNVWAVLNCG